MAAFPNNRRISLGVLSLSHFTVDLCCIFLIAGFMPVNHWVWYALLYNFCAFALQMPLGLLSDGKSRRLHLAFWGCIVVAAAFPILHLSPLISCITAGIGNALFHIGGGTYTMDTFPKKIAPLGIFVAPGAFGVFFGYLAASAFRIGNLLFPLLLLTAAAVIYPLLKKEAVRTVSPRILPEQKPLLIFGIFLLFTAVAVRAYFGSVLSFAWKTGFLFPLLFTCGIVGGKALGGLLGDRFGLISTAVFSLCMSGLCFCFGQTVPLCGILGILFFNMTMPLTLFALGEILENTKGFAFGISTFALFLGGLPDLFPEAACFQNTLGQLLLISIALLLIIGGITCGRREGGNL